MTTGSDQLRQVLAAQGFADPDAWLAYAVQHGLRQTPGSHLVACPDCGSATARRVGQFVYYSHLSYLLECLRCGLVYSDTRLDPVVTSEHFEHAYKDDTYFVQQRQAIFDELSALIDRHAPRGGTVLDVGGATGHLMDLTRRRRPDLKITVNDVSQIACRQAAERGFETMCGDVVMLRGLRRRFDVVVMSDVLYYEANIQASWAALGELLGGGGTVIIRVPNKLALMRVTGVAQRLLMPARAALADRVPFFNPEHLFVFSRAFLVRRLGEIGFTTVRSYPSRLLRARGSLAGVARLWDALAQLTAMVTGSRLLISPAMTIVASR